MLLVKYSKKIAKSIIFKEKNEQIDHRDQNHTKLYPLYWSSGATVAQFRFGFYLQNLIYYASS